MSLTQRARQLMAGSGKTLATGALVLTPLAAAPVAQAALFADPTESADVVTENYLFHNLGTADLDSQVLDSGSTLKLFGTGSGVGYTGSQFIHRYAFKPT